jgi:eukaryotic-like serine/threonine-protein kinase
VDTIINHVRLNIVLLLFVLYHNMSTRKYLPLFVFSLSLLSLPAIETSAATNLLTYQNPIQGIKMQYPSDWTVSQNGLRDFSDVAGFFAPFGNISDVFPGRLILSIRHYSENVTLNEYNNLVNSSLRQPTVQITESSPSTLAGNPAHKIVFLASPGIAPFKIETMLVWMVKGNNVYTISFNSEPEKFPTYVPTVEKMINSFELTK